MSARQSSIDRLPPDIREQLQELLRDPRVTQLAATARINEILEAEGHEERISKSAVNRYAIDMDKIGKKLREQTAIAEMWVGKFGHKPAGESGRIITQLVQLLAFETTVSMHGVEVADDERPGWLKMLKDLAIINQRLEASATLNVKREAEIRKQALDEATNAVKKTAAKAGMNAEAVQMVEAAIKEAYGA